MSYNRCFPSEHDTTSADKVSLTSANGNNRTRSQERDRGTAVSNFDLQQQVASPRPEDCRNRGINTNGQDRWENGDGVARGTIRDNERCNDSVEEVDGIEVGSRKRKRRDSFTLFRGLLGVVVAVLTTDAPLGVSIPVALED